MGGPWGSPPPHPTPTISGLSRPTMTCIEPPNAPISPPQPPPPHLRVLSHPPVTSMLSSGMKAQWRTGASWAATCRGGRAWQAGRQQGRQAGARGRGERRDGARRGKGEAVRTAKRQLMQAAPFSTLTVYLLCRIVVMPLPTWTVHPSPRAQQAAQPLLEACAPPQKRLATSYSFQRARHLLALVGSQVPELDHLVAAAREHAAAVRVPSAAEHWLRVVCGSLGVGLAVGLPGQGG